MEIAVNQTNRLWTLLPVLIVSACADSVAPSPLGSPAVGRFAVARSPSAVMSKLPTLGGKLAEAYAINDAGHAVGWSTDSAGYSYAVRWIHVSGAWTVNKIGPQATREASQALAINKHGTAVGYSEGGVNAAVWRVDGSKKIIGLQWSRATAINNLDVIVGRASPPAVTTPSPVAWKPVGVEWTRHILERLPDVTRLTCGLEDALGISDENVVVGFLYDDACTRIPVQWRPTPDGSSWLPPERLSPVGALAGGVAQAIVGRTVVGMAYPCPTLTGCVRKAYRWTLGAESGAIGSLDARANGLNQFGDIAGSYIRKGGQMIGFVWSSNTSVFLFLPSPGGTGDHWAWDINGASPRQAVGGVQISSGGRIGAVWTLD